MTAKTLNVEGFRNLAEAGITLCPGVNVVYGPNAQGKTNLLEALYVLSTGKSYRAMREQELIGHGRENARISLLYETKEEQGKLEIRFFAHKKKELYKNGVKLTRLSEYIGSFTSVIFSPEHLTLIKDGPAERRRFLDLALCQLSRRYLAEVTEYGRLLERRNALLRNIAEDRRLIDTLPVWNERLALSAAKVTLLRHRYISRLCPIAEKSHAEISGGKETLELRYLTPYEGQRFDLEELSGFFGGCYRDNAERDIRSGTTGDGPHRDDIDILINGFSARRYASQGQQRSCVLSLKEAEARLMEEQSGESPVLLLDDVLSELDRSRREYVLSGAGKRQVVVTACDYDRAVVSAGERFFSISGGRIAESDGGWEEKA